MEPEALRRRARLSQSGAEHEQSRIAGRGFDPDYIRRLEHFPQFSHAQIHARVQAMNPGDMHAAAQIWVGIADSMFGALSTLHATVQTTLAGAMSGHIADAAETAARQFVRDATDVAAIAQSTGHRVIAAAYGAEAVRKTVPPPIPDGPADSGDEQYHLALAALDANYVPIYPPAGTAIPAFFALRSPADTASEDFSGTPDSAPGAGRPTNPLADAWNGPGGTHESERQSPDTTAEATDPAGALHTPRSGSQADTQDLEYRNPDRRSPGDHSSTALQPTVAETKPTATTPPTSPFTPNPRGRPYSPAPIPATPEPGRSFPGPPNPEPLTQPRQPNSPNNFGPPGSVSPAGMIAPGSRPTTNPDSSHRTPPWLIRDRRDELLGTPLPHVPPAIGAEFPAARNDLVQPNSDDSG
ncbi:hypothetical protein ACIRRA_12495 [Nocardia sp. NPDC101769]|uniref:WXG100 family type VII secretion target n=1 Tax=Nocardia sp. NPDC101769 TaxID=3364333 RepID=UPI00380A9324